MTADQPRAGAEAARLIAAAQDWLRTSAPHLAPVDVDGTPCSCPLCRVVATVREADPDDVTRLVDTAVSALSSLAVQASDLAGSVRDQAATWASPEAYEPDADEDDAPGYAVDVDEVDDEVDDDEAPGAAAESGAGSAGDGPRTVRRITIERED
jgi:hypothetical protein